jgi:putative membrane protein
MTTRQFITATWNPVPWVLALCALIVAAYSFIVPNHRKIGWVLAGIVVLYLALDSPIAVLANGYLFSAHMLQHLLLLLIVPGLFLLSLPLNSIPSRLPNWRWRWIEFICSHPLGCWLLGVGGMWVWHAPALCNAAVSNPWIRHLQYATLSLMGVAFWWPVIGPWGRHRLSPLAGSIYLFLACIGCTLLGIVITFSPIEVCSVYLHPLDAYDVLPLIRHDWGMTAVNDQQLGGLFMWVPACLVYLCGIIGLFIRWHADGDQKVFAGGVKPPLILPDPSHER